MIPNEEEQDLKCIRAILEGRDPETAFERIHGRYRLRIENFFAHKGFARAEVPDLAQEVFLRTFRGISTFRGGASSFRSWLFAIASQFARERWKSAGRAKRKGHEVSLEGEVLAGIRKVVRSEEPGPDRVLVAKERTAELEAAIETLPKRQRECLRLRLKGYDLRQIAVLLGIESGTVRATLYHARKGLAARLVEDGDGSL